MKHLSRFDIEAIADKYVQAYMALPDVRNTQIYRIDPELLLEKVLGLNVEYQHLSYDGSILGMTSFTEMGVQVFEDDDNEAFFFLDGKTVLVEKDLNFDSKLKGRKNFTLMHEGSHQIFTLDDGTGTDRTILSGIHSFYEPEELVGKTLIAITNLPPRAMMGIDSCGMLLSAIHEEEGEWIATVKSRTINKTGCPYCSHNKVLAGFNDLATLFPEVADEWSDKNEKKPTEVMAFANSKAWWKCRTCGYEWNTLISTRSGGSKCPCCSGYIFIKGKNDLKSTHPQIAEEWSEKNYPLQSDEVNAKSRENVWWHCNKCGNEWKSVINARVKGTVCPVCAEREVLSCHSLRHTFTTRMCEAGVNVKVIQDALGHKDVSTTLNIYTDVTKELRKSEFEGLELQFNQ